MIKKGGSIPLRITEMDFPAWGAGYYEGQRIVVKGALKGSSILAEITKVKSKITGQIMEVLEPSPYEIPGDCGHEGTCGGCAFRNIAYATECKFKEEMALQLMDKAGLKGFQYKGFAPAERMERYRNKMEFSFGDDGLDGRLTLGLRKKGSYYEALDMEDCLLCHRDYTIITKEIASYFRDRGEYFFHRIRQTGTLKYLVVRRNEKGNIMVNLVTSSGFTQEKAKEFCGFLQSLKLTGEITGILHTVSDSTADAVKPDQVRVLWGESYITERLLGLNFAISPFSFFQTNTLEAEKLYATIQEFAGDVSGQTILDLYCGTGTIAQVMAKKAAAVTGVELVDEAVAAAAENARRNGLGNCRFISGDVLRVVDNLSEKPDIIILDPPREGMNPRALKKIISFAAQTLIYVSCKASSMTEDLPRFIEAGYKLEKIKIHDLFPRTSNFETCCLLTTVK